MQIPSIKIKYSFNKETEIFLDFLHHPQFPQHRNMIFRAFKELKIAFNKKNGLEEKLIIKNFIKNFRKKHNYKIKKIINQSKKLLKQNSKKALVRLGLLTDYQWLKNENYYAFPTILPFSPYKKNIFFFSILGAIYNNKQHNILFVSIHEISHFIVYKTLKKFYDKKISLKKESFYFLKEILAPVIMNQKPLQSLLKIRNYLGNPFLRYIFIINKNKKIQITTFFQRIYEKARYGGKMDFKQILEIMALLIFSIENELIKKNKIWNQYGNDLINNKTAFKKYCQPIKIEAPEQLFNRSNRRSGRC